MAEGCLRILQVNTADAGGGAEIVAWRLFRGYRAHGHRSWLAVGEKRSNDPDVFVIPNDAHRNIWARTWLAAGSLVRPLIGRVRWAGRLRKLLEIAIGQPSRYSDIWKGREDFHFPGTWHLLRMVPETPEIIHCHNLHGAWLLTGGYFDLRVLPWLTHEVPVVLTLHDAWLLTGHCAHSFDCERWKDGCGHCPDLTIYPAIRRDATSYNWGRKKEIYAKSRLYVATPSEWLMERVKQSILAPAVIQARVIANGTDLSVFKPGDKLKRRAELGIPQSAKMLVFTANGIRNNIWKDYKTLRAAIHLVAERLTGEKILFIALGEKAPAQWLNGAELRFVPYQEQPEMVASYYQAADLYVHAARADTFPNSVLEALACGIPVVATAVGGIPEQVKSMDQHDANEATGLLVAPGDARGFALAIERLLTNKELCRRLRENAASDARQRFDIKKQVETYLTWYRQIIETWTRRDCPEVRGK